MTTSPKTHLKASGLRRLAWGCAAGVALGLLLLPFPLPGLVRGLMGWTGGTLAYLVQAWWLAKTCDAARTRARAQSLDQPDVLILIVTGTAVCACVAVITMLLQQVKQMIGLERIAYVGLGLAALATSWLLIHTIYAFHYAHRYYQEEQRGMPNGGGLAFPGKGDPQYFDFLYFSFVIGMTSQVSDVQVTSSGMRVLTLVQGVLAFAFNMLVLALSINVVAGAI